MVIGLAFAGLFPFASLVHAACTNPSPLPSGFAAPCPVFSLSANSVSQSQTLTLSAAPQPGTDYILTTAYISQGTAWNPYTLQGNNAAPSYSTALASLTLSSAQLSSLSLGTHYAVSWDWLWDATAQCYKGPGLNQCNTGQWRVQSFSITATYAYSQSAYYAYTQSAYYAYSQSSYYVYSQAAYVTYTYSQSSYYAYSQAAYTSGTSWYARQSCANNGNGSSSACAASAGGAGAWKGFSSIVWSSVHAGDTLYLVSGEIYTAPLNIGASGISGKPITVSVSGGGTATIDDANGTSVGINISGNSYVTVDGVYGNAVAGNTTYGIKVINIGQSGYCGYEYNGGHHYKFLHVDCSGSAPGASQPDDNRGGFFLGATGNGGVEVAYNWVHGPAFPQYSSQKWGATGITLFASTGTTNFNDSLIHNNRVDQMYNDGIRCGANCSVYNNEVSHIDGSGHSDSLLIQSSSYSAIYNNYVHDSGDQNIYLDNLYDSICGHIRVYNNLINSNPGFGIVVDPEGAAGSGVPTSNCTTGSRSGWNDIVIANNTFYSTSASQIRKGRDKDVTNLVIKNNIFGIGVSGGYNALDLYNVINATLLDANAWDYDVFAGSASTPVSNYNGAADTLAQLQALTVPREVHGKMGVPTYVNASVGDFHLASGDTVARGAGVNVASMYAFVSTNKDGLSRPSSGSWDMGAY